MDLRHIAALVAGIATIVIIVLATRLDAFIALLIAALVTGVVAGQDLLSLIDAVTTGFGTTLASIGIVIGLGVGIGKILEVSGAADSLARAFLRAFGKGREPWAMGSVGSLVSIPVFCDSGYVIMNPLARSIARVKRGGYITLALALGAGMTLTHHMVPPTPGPLGRDRHPRCRHRRSHPHRPRLHRPPPARRRHLRALDRPEARAVPQRQGQPRRLRNGRRRSGDRLGDHSRHGHRGRGDGHRGDDDGDSRNRGRREEARGVPRLPPPHHPPPPHRREHRVDGDRPQRPGRALRG